MRDGVTLAADIWRPAVEGQFPALLQVSYYVTGPGLAEPLTPRGYVCILANSRGRGGSEGEWDPYVNEPATYSTRRSGWPAAVVQRTCRHVRPVVQRIHADHERTAGQSALRVHGAGRKASRVSSVINTTTVCCSSMSSSRTACSPPARPDCRDTSPSTIRISCSCRWWPRPTVCRIRRPNASRSGWPTRVRRTLEVVQREGQVSADPNAGLFCHRLVRQSGARELSQLPGISP